MDELPINADTVNKALDIVEESTKETRKELDKTGAKGVHKLAELLWASPIGRKADLYIAERPYKMKKAMEEMQRKYDKIPVEYQVEPSSYIALKGVNELNYSLDEEHLKEMFENILVSDMDNRKKNKVLPSYIEIVKQLTPDDVKFLKLLKKWDCFCAIEIQLKTNGIYSTTHLDEYYIYNYKNKDNIEEASIEKANPIVIDTLSYLNLIKNKIGTYYTQKEKEYTYLFDNTKTLYQFDPNMHTVTYEKCTIEFTRLGKDFIDICLS